MEKTTTFKETNGKTHTHQIDCKLQKSDKIDKDIILTLFDIILQYAADERIQLEALFDLYDYRKNDNKNNNTNNNTHVGKFNIDTIIQINLSMIDLSGRERTLQCI